MKVFDKANEKCSYYGLNHRRSLCSQLSNGLENIHSSLSFQLLNTNIQCDKCASAPSSSAEKNNVWKNGLDMQHTILQQRKKYGR